MEYKTLLDAFAELPPLGRHESTLLEVAGFEEKVATRILRFYLSPEREHNWGMRLLNALLTCAKWPGVPPDPDSVSVLPPDQLTAGGKKPDLIIESDTVVIGIENKITKKLAEACGNPFAEYMKFLQSLCDGTTRSPLLILLTPLPVNCPNIQVPIQYITYGALFKTVSKLLLERDIDQKSRHASLWHDFEQTMEYLSEESKYEEAVDQVIQKHPIEVSELASEMNRKIEQIKRCSETLLRQRGKKCGRWGWKDERKLWKERLPFGQLQRRWKNVLFYSCFIEVRIWPKSRTFIQAAIYFGEGWETQIFEERPHRLGDPPTRLKKWLKRHGIETTDALLENLLAHGEVLSWETDAQTVAEQFCELVCLVVRALGTLGSPEFPPSPAPLPTKPGPSSGTSEDVKKKLADIMKRIRSSPTAISSGLQDAKGGKGVMDSSSGAPDRAQEKLNDTDTPRSSPSVISRSIQQTEARKSMSNSRHICDERCKAILESICPGRVEHQKSFRNRPFIRLDKGAAQGPFLYVSSFGDMGTGGEGRIALSIFPAIGVQQAQVFYGNIDTQRFLALRARGWETIPFLRFSFIRNPLETTHPSENGLNLEDYLSYWRNHSDRIEQVKRQDFDTGFNRLLEAKVMSQQDIQKVRRTIANRPWFDLGPAVNVTLSWSKEEATLLDADRRFIATVLGHINEVLTTWGATLPRDRLA